MMKEPIVSREAIEMAEGMMKTIHSRFVNVVWEWIVFGKDIIKSIVKYAGRAGMVLGVAILWNAVSLESIALGLVGLAFMIIGAFIAQKN